MRARNFCYAHLRNGKVEVQIITETALSVASELEGVLEPPEHPPGLATPLIVKFNRSSTRSSTTHDNLSAITII